MATSHYPTPAQARADLNTEERRLTNLDAAVPAEPLAYLGHLTVRHDILAVATTRARALVHALRDAGQDSAAAEHTVQDYRRQYDQARHAMETARLQAADR